MIRRLRAVLLGLCGAVQLAALGVLGLLMVGLSCMYGCTGMTAAAAVGSLVVSCGYGVTLVRAFQGRRVSVLAVGLFEVLAGCLTLANLIDSGWLAFDGYPGFYVVAWTALPLAMPVLLLPLERWLHGS